MVLLRGTTGYSQADSLFFLQGAEKKDVLLSDEEFPEEGREKGKKLLCKSCRNEITDEFQAIEVDQLHSHTFFNPAGLVFEISCFADACGCMTSGRVSTEFSWFSGTGWQIVLCRGCRAHLGWLFQGADNHFYGLIRNRLIPE